MLRVAGTGLLLVAGACMDTPSNYGATDTGAAAAGGTATAATTGATPAQLDSATRAGMDSAARMNLDTAAINALDSIRKPALPVSDARVEVDVTARKLHLYRGSQRIASHPVAVGSTEWPTRLGDWNITQVVFNPEWIPPDESWAEQREPRKPGEPANPLGQAQLIYDPPRSIHGTNDPKSIGKAVSHGSIRVTNQVARQLARQLLEFTGVARDEAWYQATQQNRTVKQIVDLPQLVPIRVF